MGQASALACVRPREGLRGVPRPPRGRPQRIFHAHRKDTYFRGKALVEEALRGAGLSHTILRPALLFGEGAILVNYIAWMLRRFPVFGVFGSGDFGVRPIHVEDLAELAVRHGASREDAVRDAVGPETFTYRDLVRAVAAGIGVRRPILRLPRAAAFASELARRQPPTPR